MQDRVMRVRGRTVWVRGQMPVSGDQTKEEGTSSQRGDERECKKGPRDFEGRESGFESR